MTPGYFFFHSASAVSERSILVAVFARGDRDFYAHRRRSCDESLPWALIALRIGRAYLQQSYDDVFEQIRARRPAANAPASPSVVS